MDSDPLDPVELKTRCRGWPASVVRSAVLEVLYDGAGHQAEAQALSSLVAIWLTEDDASEPPPLSSVSIARIWRQLTTHLQ